MLAIWLEDQRLNLRADLPPPEPPPGEALIRVLRAGICNTDIELVRGYYPYRGILGHEFVGEVARGPSHLVGRRVVGEINAVCHHCEQCRGGRLTHCSNRSVLGIVNRHGAFAEYLTLPTENLHLVPDEVSTDSATYTEPLAAALQIAEQVSVAPGDRALVVGDGKLGQLIAQTLQNCGCDLLVSGRHPEKLDILRQLSIAVTTDEQFDDGSFDIAVEATGNPTGFASARRALRPRGTLVLKSTYAGQLTFDASALVVDEITLIGSRCGPFEPALKQLRSNQVDVDPLTSARFPLADGLAAFEKAQEPGVLKVLLDV